VAWLRGGDARRPQLHTCRHIEVAVRWPAEKLPKSATGDDQITELKSKHYGAREGLFADCLCEGLFSPGIAAGQRRHFSDKPTIRECDNKRSFPGAYPGPESC
jgi:hypothetical protein